MSWLQEDGRKVCITCNQLLADLDRPAVWKEPLEPTHRLSYREFPRYHCSKLLGSLNLSPHLKMGDPCALLLKDSGCTRAQGSSAGGSDGAAVQGPNPRMRGPGQERAARGGTAPEAAHPSPGRNQSSGPSPQPLGRESLAAARPSSTKKRGFQAN